MLRKIRSGDILLCLNKQTKETISYLVTTNSETKIGITCLMCGELEGSSNNVEWFEDVIRNKLNLVQVIAKEDIADYINNKYKLKDKVKAHDSLFCDFGMEWNEDNI